MAYIVIAATQARSRRCEAAAVGRRFGVADRTRRRRRRRRAGEDLGAAGEAGSADGGHHPPKERRPDPVHIGPRDRRGAGGERAPIEVASAGRRGLGAAGPRILARGRPRCGRPGPDEAVVDARSPREVGPWGQGWSECAHGRGPRRTPGP